MSTNKGYSQQTNKGHSVFQTNKGPSVCQPIRDLVIVVISEGQSG